MVLTTGGIALTLGSLEPTFYPFASLCCVFIEQKCYNISKESEVNLMEIQITIKVKLNLANAEIASSFTNTMEQYRLACNYGEVS